MRCRYLPILVACVVGWVNAPAPVVAADMPVKARPVVAPAPLTWTGWYGGVSIGYASGEVTLGTPSNPLADSLEPNSVVAALVGGADYQFANNFVIGARVILPFFSLSDSIVVTGANETGKVKYAVIFAGRLGYSFGQWMPYILGGGVWGKGQADRAGVGSIEASHSGYIVGVGSEYRVSRNWSLDANYTFISMSKETYNFVPFGGLATSYGFDSHNFMIGVNWRP